MAALGMRVDQILSTAGTQCLKLMQVSRNGAGVSGCERLLNQELKLVQDGEAFRGTRGRRQGDPTAQ